MTLLHSIAGVCLASAASLWSELIVGGELKVPASEDRKLAQGHPVVANPLRVLYTANGTNSRLSESSNSSSAAQGPVSRIMLLELFSAAQSLYTRQLSSAIRHADVHVEPALRMRDGQLAVDGPLRLPYRADMIPRNGEGKSIPVDSSSRISFKPVTIKYKNCDVLIHPFAWDWVQVSVMGLPESEVAAIAREWFLHWFDPEDSNAMNDQGLYGVAHYLGDPQAVDGGVRLTTDLGSAPAEALDDLLEKLSDRGAAAVSVE